MYSNIGINHAIRLHAYQIMPGGVYASNQPTAMARHRHFNPSVMRRNVSPAEQVLR